MTSTKLSAQDRKDLEKFTKYLVFKSVQVIVQSRLGEKTRTQSKPFSSGSDWFNLALRDLNEVTVETKKVFNSGLLDLGSHVCVEMSLRTVEGETMVLETWSLGMAEQCDPSARVSYTVYNRMGIMLKSLICVTRQAPTYRLSRKQGADTYVICYRVYKGEAAVHHLGEDYQTLRVGAVPTPVGTIVLHLHYRTKMLFSPQPLSRDLSADLKDDHFMADLSPRKSNGPRPCHTVYTRQRRHSSSEALDVGSSESECCATMFSTSPMDHSPGYLRATPPPSRAHLHRKTSLDETHIHYCGVEKTLSFSQGQKMGAFAPVRETEHHSDYDDIPFMALLQPDDDKECECVIDGMVPQGADTVDARGPSEPMDVRSTGSSNKSSESSGHASAPEDYVMVELKTPFAGSDANSDLGRFYKDCQVAPTLEMFKDHNNVEDAINAITDQLATFEANAKDFDDFVNSFVIDEEEDDEEEEEE